MLDTITQLIFLLSLKKIHQVYTIVWLIYTKYYRTILIEQLCI